MKQIFKKAAYCLSLFSVFALASCGSEPDRSPLRIASNGWAGFEPFYIAETMGLMDKKDLHLIETPVTMGLVQAFRGTTIDAAAVSLSRAISWAHEDVDLAIIMVLDTSDGGDVVMAHPTIETIQDLRGKRLGTSLATVNGYLMARALEKAGIGLDEVTLVDMQNEELPEAYMNGEVDAVSVYGIAEKWMQESDAHTIFSSSDIPGEIADVLAVRTPYLEKNREKVEKLVTSWIMARHIISNWPRENPLPHGSVDSELMWDNISRVHLSEIEENTALLANDGAKLKSLMQKRHDISYRLGLVGEVMTLPKIDSEPYQNALKEFQKQYAHYRDTVKEVD